MSRASRLLRRLGFYATAAWAALSLNFALPRMMPGDPATALFARLRGRVSPEAMAPLREALGLHGGSLASQYATYLQHLARGDLGVSTASYPATVSQLIAGALPWTLLVAGTSLVVAFALGTALGVVTAWRRGGLLDRWLPPALTLAGAFPYFWVAMAALYVLGFRLGWVPLGHAHSDDVTPAWSIEFALDVARHAALPVATVVLSNTGGWLLAMRSSMITTLGADHVALARAKGLSPTRVVLAYAARTAILPSFTGFGMALGFVLGGSLLTEVVFSYPGQGWLLVQAVRNQDYPLMQGVFLTITLAVLSANLAVDVLYAWLDPRTEEDA